MHGQRHVPMGPLSWQSGNSRKHLLDAIDASLKRLATDYVDLYQLHYDDAKTPLDETLAALDTIVRSGRARYVGVSNFQPWRLARAIGRSEANQWARPVAVQPRYNLLFRQIERDLVPLCLEDGLAMLCYNPPGRRFAQRKTSFQRRARYAKPVRLGQCCGAVQRPVLARARVPGCRCLFERRGAGRHPASAPGGGLGAGATGADECRDRRLARRAVDRGSERRRDPD